MHVGYARKFSRTINTSLLITYLAGQHSAYHLMTVIFCHPYKCICSHHGSWQPAHSVPSLLHPIPISSLQVQLADVKLAADSRDQRRVETPPRVLMKTRAAADRAARAAAAAANGEGLGHANSRYCILMNAIEPCSMHCAKSAWSVEHLPTSVVVIIRDRRAAIVSRLLCVLACTLCQMCSKQTEPGFPSYEAF